MFDSVGQSQDPERAQRSVAASVGLCVLVAVSGLAVWLQAPQPAPVPPPPPDDMVLLFDVPNDPDAEWELPPPPDPAPREQTDVPDTGMFDTAIPGMDPEDRQRDTGEGAQDTGEVPGEASGEGTGVEPGTGTTRARPEPQRTVRPQPVPRPEPVENEPVYDLPVRNRLRARYPSAARRRDRGDVTCRMSAWIDRDGEARRIQAISCPPIFRANARDALWSARWEPFEAPDTNTWRKIEIDIPFRQ